MVHCVCQTKATYRINKNNWLKKKNFLNRVFLLQPIFMLTAISLKQKKTIFFGQIILLPTFCVPLQVGVVVW